MKRQIAQLLVVVALTTAVGAGADGLPPADWGDPAVKVIPTPHLCRGPLSVDDGVDVHLCTGEVLGHEALVSYYFVDGVYACYSVTMQSATPDTVDARLDFEAVVDRLAAEIGPPVRRTDTATGDAVVTWAADGETVRAAVDSSGATPLIGIVAFDDDHRQRVARLISW